MDDPLNVVGVLGPEGTLLISEDQMAEGYGLHRYAACNPRLWHILYDLGVDLNCAQ